MRAPRLLWFLPFFVVALTVLNVSAQSPDSASTPASSEIKTLNSSSTAESSTAPTTKAADSRSDQRDSDSQPSEKRKLRLRFGGLAVGAGYSHFSGPIYPYGYPYGLYSLYPGDWYGGSVWAPIWSPYPYYGPNSFAYNNGRGEVRLSADPKVAKVYIDGGYAGTADKLKTLWLDPGAYDLTVSSPGCAPFHQRVYVLSGKSLKITAKLNPEDLKEKP